MIEECYQLCLYTIRNTAQTKKTAYIRVKIEERNEENIGKAKDNRKQNAEPLSKAGLELLCIRPE